MNYEDHDWDGRLVHAEARSRSVRRKLDRINDNLVAIRNLVTVVIGLLVLIAAISVYLLVR